jgi:outer membrane biosynthesis protein TonB
MRTPRLAAAVFSMLAVALVAAPAIAQKKKDENKEEKREEKKAEEKKAEKKEEKKAEKKEERREERKKEEEAKKADDKKPEDKKDDKKPEENNKVECKATYGATTINVDPGTTLPGAASPMCFARAGSQLGPVVCKAGMSSIIFKSKYGVEPEKPNTLDCRKYVH